MPIGVGLKGGASASHDSVRTYGSRLQIVLRTNAFRARGYRFLRQRDCFYVHARVPVTRTSSDECSKISMQNIPVSRLPDDHVTCVLRVGARCIGCMLNACTASWIDSPIRPQTSDLRHQTSETSQADRYIATARHSQPDIASQTTRDRQERTVTEKEGKKKQIEKNISFLLCRLGVESCGLGKGRVLSRSFRIEKRR
jgi:hypothetical protein